MTNKIRKINALDFVIIAVVILSIASFAFRYRRTEEISSSSIEGKYEISFAVRDVRYTTADAFVQGDRVYVTNDDTYIGVFDRIDSNNPAAYYATSSTGEKVKLYYPEATRIDLTGKIISEGVMNDDGYFAGGSYFLAPGKWLSIYTGRVYIDIVLTDIVPYEE